MLREALVEPPNLLLKDDGYLFLVHGYANSEDDAGASYDKLTARLSPYWQSRVVHVFWPGDGTDSDGVEGNRSWLYPLKKKAGYPKQPTRAVPS